MKSFRFKVTTGPVVRPQSNGSDSHSSGSDNGSATSPTSPIDNTTKANATKSRKWNRSRAGCVECRRRRVKCDETFPVCHRCQRRGSVCEAATRLRKWQMESPWISGKRKPQLEIHRELPTQLEPRPDKSLIQYWLERASQIMAIDPDINPMSFPVLEHIGQSPGLIHAIQSVSAAHQHFFDQSKLARCLEERDLAIRLVQREIAHPPQDVFPVFMTVLVLGLSTAWIEGPTTDFGLQHLRGARALIDILLADPNASQERPSQFGFMIGAYLYWEMSCAFLVPSSEQLPEHTPEILLAVLDIGSQYHPIGGYCTEMFYFLGTVGRYCRFVHDTGIRDHDLEAHLESQLLDWKPPCESPTLIAMCEAFRSHGLINLAAICKRGAGSTAAVMNLSAIDNTPDSSSFEYPPPPSSPNDPSSPDTEYHDNQNLEHQDQESLDKTIRERAARVIRTLCEIPETDACTNLQAIPLLTAGSELTLAEQEERELVQQRFQAIYSLNHLRANLVAVQLLRELWELRDSGLTVSWLELMLDKGWSIMLG